MNHGVARHGGRWPALALAIAGVTGVAGCKAAPLRRR